jgi:hypothetical protein
VQFVIFQPIDRSEMRRQIAKRARIAIDKPSESLV